MQFNQMLNDIINTINESLNIYVNEQKNLQNNIYKAMRYSLFAGGKRLRPVLTIASYKLFKDNIDIVIPMACAMEMIHTYSLIHDDLPAMDNDDLRRGKPTNHIKFGDDIAILSGDALLNKAFEIGIIESIKKGICYEQILKALSIMASASGSEGMIGGQVVDIESEGSYLTEDKLTYMYKHKTGALITAAVKIGAIIAGATDREITCLSNFSEKIGLAFQIIDDILDVEGDIERLGKTIGSDKINKKVTFVTLIGINESKILAKKLTDEALKELEVFNEKAWFLKELANYMINRKN